MASNATNRDQKPETVQMQAGWGDVREVIPEMVPVLEAQGWKRVVATTTTKQEQNDEAGKQR